MLIPEHGGLVMAGLLTFPNLFCLPGMHQWLYTNRLIKGGLQQQVLFRTLTGFPFIVALWQDYLMRPQSYNFF